MIIKTNLENPPPELMYCWREPYEVFPVKDNGTVEGLSMDHPRFVILEYEWKLVVEPVAAVPAVAAKPVAEKADVKKEGVSQGAVTSVVENTLVKEV